MIEVLQGFPEDVVAFSAKGRVTRRDYDHVLIPKVREALAGHKSIRCYYELTPSRRAPLEIRRTGRSRQATNSLKRFAVALLHGRLRTLAAPEALSNIRRSW
jgi:hypothetical protein